MLGIKIGDRNIKAASNHKRNCDTYHLCYLVKFRCFKRLFTVPRLCYKAYGEAQLAPTLVAVCGALQNSALTY